MVCLTLCVLNVSLLWADDTRLEVTINNGAIIYSDPVIINIDNITKNTLDLRVDADDTFANTSLNYEVTITNIITGTVASSNYLRSTDINSETVLAISGLLSGVEYKFEVQYAPIGNAYTAKSLPHNALTIIDAPTLESIENINDNSLDLNVVVGSEFLGEIMDFSVEVYKNGRYSHLVQLTRNIVSNHVALPIDDIDSSEEYTFKIKYARENTVYFSDYSNEKSIKNINNELAPPIIIRVDDITINSLNLLIEVDGHRGKDLIFRIKIINKKTGKIKIMEVSRIVRSNDTVKIHIDRLDYNTEYKIKVRYFTNNSTDHSEYSNSKSIWTKNIQSQGKITVCYSNEIVNVSAEKLQFYMNNGATIGVCHLNNTNVDKINVCYKNENAIIFQEDLQNYISRGATKGYCKNIELKEEEIEVCYNNETIWVTLKSQIYHEATPGKCKNKKVVKWKDYKIISIIGAIAGICIAISQSVIPLFVVSPKHFGGAVVFRIIRLWKSLIWRKGLEKKWGNVFEVETHSIMKNIKIILKDRDGKKIAENYSDEGGNFGFTVGPGKYVMEVENNMYKLMTTINEEVLVDNVYDGALIVINEEKDSPNVNIVIKSKKIRMEEYTKEKLKQYKSFWSNFKKVLFPILFIIGLLWTVMAVYYLHTIFYLVMAGIYVIIFMAQIFLVRSGYGAIYLENGDPVSFAVIKLYDKMFNEEYGFAVSDSIGRYYLQAKNGEYGVEIQSQLDGQKKIDEKFSTSIKNGILHKKIIIKK